MFSIAARFHVLTWVAWTPNFFDSSESVISSQIASSATLALNSGAWFFLFVILDRLSLQAIHFNKWSEIPRPPLLEPVRGHPKPLRAAADHPTSEPLDCASRGWQRHGILRPPTIGGDKPAKTRFKPHSIGYFHINPAEGKRTIPVAIDRKLTLAHLRLKKMAGEVEPAQVLGGASTPTTGSSTAS
jgi:hypothetical protein